MQDIIWNIWIYSPNYHKFNIELDGVKTEEINNDQRYMIKNKFKIKVVKNIYFILKQEHHFLCYKIIIFKIFCLKH